MNITDRDTTPTRDEQRTEDSKHKARLRDGTLGEIGGQEVGQDVRC